MHRVVIVGAGGHAQVVADILLRAQDQGEAICPIGYVDDNSALRGETLLDLPVLGTIADLQSLPHDAIIVAIGDNHTRRKMFDRLHSQGERFAIAKHPAAIVAPNVRFGVGTVVCAGAIINPGSMIGSNVILNTASSVDHHNHIANHVHIAPGAHVGGDVAIGEGTLIGIGATVMPQRRIGAWSVVGAGSLAHRDVPDHVTIVGVPARIIKKQAKGKEDAYSDVLA